MSCKSRFLKSRFRIFPTIHSKNTSFFFSKTRNVRFSWNQNVHHRDGHEGPPALEASSFSPRYKPHATSPYRPPATLSRLASLAGGGGP